MSPQINERILIIIPAYNEQGAIRGVVSSVRKAVRHADVLVIDDGSSDTTAREARLGGAYVVRHPFNLGIGGAVQTGLKFARARDYDIVVRMDGDGQHDSGEVAALLQLLRVRQADVVIGSRFIEKDSTMSIPLLRRLGIRLFALEVRLLTGAPATDTTSGFMAMNRRAVEVLAASMPQDYPEVESRILLHKAGLVTLELPTRMLERRSGVTSIDGWRSLYYAFKVSVAVLISAIKDIPAPSKETFDVHPGGPAAYSTRLQPAFTPADRSIDPEAQAP